MPAAGIDDEIEIDDGAETSGEHPPPMPPTPLPPDLLLLAQQAQPPLQSAAVRLAPSDLARVETLRARLGCRRSAVLRGLLLTGLAAVESQQRGEVVIHG